MYENVILQWILEEWQGVSDRYRPNVLWIRRYPAVPDGTDGFDDEVVFPDAVWIAEGDDLRRESVWKWRRFLMVQWGQPWCVPNFKSPSQLVKDDYKIGLVAFAPYSDTEGYYVEFIWGKTFGTGLKVTCNDKFVIIRQRIWVS